MSEKLKESISALMDGEADEFELRRALDEVAKAQDLRDLWDRYHLIGAHLRDESRGSSTVGMRERVWRALDQEGSGDVTDMEAADLQEFLRPPKPKVDRRFRWLSSSIAAGVALLAVLFISQPDDGTLDSPELAANSVQIDGVEIGLSNTASLTDVRRTNGYMVHHAQNSAMNQASMVSFVKMMTYERARGTARSPQPAKSQ